MQAARVLLGMIYTQTPPARPWQEIADLSLLPYP